MDTVLLEVEDGVVVKMKGRLDTLTSKDVAPVFTEAGEKYDRVTLDMTDVNYISSAGVRAIMQVFKMTGLASLFGLE